MPLVRVPEPFDHPDWLFELKHDGFRALAEVEGQTCRLISRRGHIFTRFNMLADYIAHSVQADRVTLDGEIVCLAPDGRSLFYPLMFRRESPYFYAFDLLSVEREDLRGLPLLARKRRLRSILPTIGSRLLYVDHFRTRGIDLFREACERDLEGIVAKWSQGRYETDGISTSWLKIKNPTYSQMSGRREVFDLRRDQRQRSRGHSRAPLLRLNPAAVTT
jgi:bifunctional non-homologous end joining protein LigD